MGHPVRCLLHEPVQMPGYLLFRESANGAVDLSSVFVIDQGWDALNVVPGRCDGVKSRDKLGEFDSAGVFLGQLVEDGHQSLTISAGWRPEEHDGWARKAEHFSAEVSIVNVHGLLGVKDTARKRISALPTDGSFSDPVLRNSIFGSTSPTSYDHGLSIHRFSSLISANGGFLEVEGATLSLPRVASVGYR